MCSLQIFTCQTLKFGVCKNRRLCVETPKSEPRHCGGVLVFFACCSAIMKCLVLLCLIFVASCFAESDVVVLTAENFDQSISKGDWLLEFYAPWSPFCSVNRMMTIFAGADTARNLLQPMRKSPQN